MVGSNHSHCSTAFAQGISATELEHCGGVRSFNAALVHLACLTCLRWLLMLSWGQRAHALLALSRCISLCLQV